MIAPTSPADRLRHVIDRFFTNAQPRRLGVAVSGGSDSMALLNLIVAGATARDVEVRAVTVDHGLRPEAKDEAAMVAAFCSSLGIPHDTLPWSGWDGRGNLQAMARQARYGMIREWASAGGVDLVALGHTLDDQAETVLMHLARRSGVDGLAGMAERFERDGLPYVRPLIGQQRRNLRAYLEEHGIRWCDDPSNDDVSFERVRARRALSILSDLGIDADALGDVAANARSAKVALDLCAWREVNGDESVEDRGDIVLSEGPHDEEIGRRILIGALRWISGEVYPPRAASLVEMRSALAQAERHTLQGCLVSREICPHGSGHRLRITREFRTVETLRSPTDSVWDGRWRLDGPHSADLEIGALGQGLSACPDWRDTGLPRTSLLASPAIWRGDTLIAAPLAGLPNGWTAQATGRGNFADFLLSR
ncbi:tRNA lysidine(34) synthetase TilS [Silicimonas algicola]|uniref:tRNA(Ile)-lysidine synthase n=1 Tax=Silicimonas algicola TaxID=1826607 RepID=A0A316GDE0_9RHOB|nr:tRNA lysidine(34) synthetase TilS [Silicimonas algicola]AZQ66398.1 tRNA lysidine(34) synthetase TilS [Silicimonas algicola]PWK58732.1 tRNA(Ile)-lysidine synthase [Silicimonas algicola]